MGMLNRTRKKKKQYQTPPQPTFKKKKIKVGRKQIAANFTRVDFKTRRIHLPPQLTDHTDPTTHLNTLLSQLRHHNVNTRLHAVTSLHNLANKDPDLIRHSLADIIHRLEPLFTDTCSDIQTQLDTFLDLLFSCITPELISPHIPLLVAYLNVSLTHTQSSIQKSGLKIGRSLVSYYPREISHHAHTILPKYLSIITGPSIPRPITRRTPTFSQLVAPGVLTLFHTSEHSQSAFENILSTATLLAQESDTEIPIRNSLTNNSLVHIPPRTSHIVTQPVRLYYSVIAFFSSYIPAAWSQFTELHSTLSSSSLGSDKLQGRVNTLSAIIDTYLLLPLIITPIMLEHVETSVVEHYSSQKQSWLREFTQFIQDYFPIEPFSLSLLRESSHLNDTTSAACNLNHRLLHLYASVHIVNPVTMRFNSDKIMQFIDTLDLSQSDIASLISLLHSLSDCKCNECSQLIQGVCAVVWEYLQKYGSKDEVLDFVLFLLDFYFEVTSSELKSYIDSILSSLSSLVEDCISAAVATHLVSSISRLFTHSCAPHSLISSRNSIILSLLRNLLHSEYPLQIQRNIINLVFFSDLDDTRFLVSLYDLVTQLPRELSLHLLDVLVASCQINNSNSSHVITILRKLKQSSTNFGSSLSDSNQTCPLAERAATYLDQLLVGVNNHIVAD